VPSNTDTCASIFVTAIDTNPLAGSVKTALSGREDDFKTGLTALTRLTEGKVRLCTAPGAGLPTVDGVDVEEFGGKHPAGLAGTHIHMLESVSRSKSVWHIGYQDVAAIGTLVSTGQYDPVRVVAVAGPVVREPRLIRTRLGACISELTAGQLPPDQEVRIISGSILHGRTSQDEAWCYLGRYHNQVSCLAEERDRILFGWLMPGLDKFSSIRTFASGLMGMNKRSRPMTTTSNGSHRAMVPIGMFERVMPLDIMPTFLLRSLVVDDLERAEALGCLELDEEDLALCSFVSPGKEDFGRALRRNLDTIWKEG
jgi:Na+-transporting NADH:ubiquinone oxidoreductase subunit A